MLELLTRRKTASQPEIKDPFTDLVETFRKRDSDALIFCAASEHAILVAKHLLQIAGDKKEDVKVISGSLPDYFYDELVPDANYCMAKGSKFEVLVQNAERDLSTSKLSNTVRGHGFNVLKPKHEIPVSLAEFILVGDRRFWSIYTQNASFNCPSVAGSISDIYSSARQVMF